MPTGLAVVKDKQMDKHDRDPWHDAETVPLWLIVIIVVVVLIIAVTV